MRVNEDNWWVYIMLFSTLVPTAVYLFIASWSVLLWLPTRLVDWVTSEWRHEQLKKDALKFFSAWLYWVVFAPLALFAPLLMFYMVYLVLHDWGHGYYLGGELLVFMEELSVDVAAWTEGFAQGFVVPK